MMKVSIIIPIYNVARYVEQCISSVMGLSVTDGVECIVVDDGSTDGSMGIVERLIDGYDGDVVFRLVCCNGNGGPAAARNRGLELALGEWVVFIDGDDFVDRDYISGLLEIVDEHPDVDFVDAGVWNCRSGRVVGVNVEFDDVVGDDPKRLIEHFGGLLFNKLFRRDILNDWKDNKPLRFDEEMRIAEDTAFIVDYLQRVRRYAFSSRMGYYYRRDNGSSLTNVKGRKIYAVERHNFMHLYLSTMEYLRSHGLSIKDTGRWGALLAVCVPRIFDGLHDEGVPRDDRMRVVISECSPEIVELLKMHRDAHRPFTRIWCLVNGWFGVFDFEVWCLRKARIFAANMRD